MIHRLYHQSRLTILSQYFVLSSGFLKIFNLIFNSAFCQQKLHYIII
ncbi:hypothetical protein [Moraxella lacunata]